MTDDVLASAEEAVVADVLASAEEAVVADVLASAEEAVVTDDALAAAEAADRAPRTWPALGLAGFAVAWLAAMMWSAHATVGAFGDGLGTDDGSPGHAADMMLALNSAVLALPTVISASMVAGVAVGFVAVEYAGRRLRRDALPVRLAAGSMAGLVVGLVVAALIVTGYGSGSPVVVIAAGVGAASLLGGLLNVVRPAGIVGAAVTGTLAWFLLGLLQGVLNDQLLRLFGAGGSAASRVHATSRLLMTVAVSGGIIAGLSAYRYLRPRMAGLHWPAYLAAGAGPGLLLLLANLVALAAGARLRTLAAAASAADSVALRYIGTAGLDTALVLLFVGAVTAMIAYGRTLKAPETREV